MEEKFREGMIFGPVRNKYFMLTFPILSFTLVLAIFFTGRLRPPGLVDILYILIWVFAFAYYLWQWTSGTYYRIGNGCLFYRSGFTKGAVPIGSIRKIETHSRGWGLAQAALTFRGLMVTYNKWDEVFIAPQNQEAFLQELLRQNPAIQILRPEDKKFAN